MIWSFIIPNAQCKNGGRQCGNFLLNYAKTIAMHTMATGNRNSSCVNIFVALLTKIIARVIFTTH